jgi:hypothetical protein
VTALTYFGLVTTLQRKLFAVTTALVSLLAAGLAAQAVLFLQQAGVVTILGDTAWDTSSVLTDTSLFGRALHTLLGYSDEPIRAAGRHLPWGARDHRRADEDARGAARAEAEAGRGGAGGVSGERSFTKKPPNDRTKPQSSAYQRRRCGAHGGRGASVATT